MGEDLVSVAAEVAAVLDQMGVPYAVGGSYASAAHGLFRATQDIDLVADIQPWQVQALVEALQADFYIDEACVAEAISTGRSFNVIHFGTLLKVDVFVRGRDAFRATELTRRQLEPVEDARLYVITPEDTVLAKLQWYRLGGEVSERQWRDVLGVLQVQHGRLEMEYLRDWAERLGVTDLLERALAEATG